MVNRLKAFKVIVCQLKFILTKRQKHLLIFVIVLTIINALLQTLGVSIIAPLVSAMTAPDAFMENDNVKYFCSLLNISDVRSIFVLLCVVVIFVYLFKDGFSIFQLWVATRYANKVNRELSTSLFEGYLKRDYDFFLNYGTAQTIRDIYTDAGGVYNVLDAMINLLTELLTILFIVVYITLMDWQMAICILGVAGLCLLIINTFFRKKMKENGAKGRIYGAEVQKSLMQAIEGIKEVQVMHKQKYFVNTYWNSFIRTEKPSVMMAVGLSAPTYVVEGLFVAGIMTFICFRVVTDPNYISAVPFLASFMMGAIRMLPSLGRISARVNSISFNIVALQSVYNNMKAFDIGNTDYPSKKGDIHKVGDDAEKIVGTPNFEGTLELSDITYRYKDATKDVLDKLNMSISRGQSVGIIGASGAGKSTLADIILGLHVPQNGKVLLDGTDIMEISEEYGNIIGFVPQSVYLVDGDVRNNVAFGVAEEEIDENRIWECLEKSQLADFIRKKESGLDTIIGERGVKLSGGQRQRIAVARALYRNPQILVLDEATSALDNDTEAAVMEAIEGLYGTITMIIIAHRLSTVRKCDVVYEITNGKAVERNKQDLFGA